MEKPDNQLKRLNFILLSMVVVLSAIMILMNFYTIKILSASRAYINGESQYSKGQKEASGHLITYIYTQNPEDYEIFLKQISIPIGDRIARETLSTKGPVKVAREGFLQAKNDIKDIDDLVWLFQTFKNVGMFKKAISIWEEGDILVEKLRLVGISAHDSISGKSLNTAERDNMIASVNDVTTKLTIKEVAFSDTLGNVCRKVNFYLFVANIVIVLIIIVSAVFYTGRLIHKIEHSRKRITVQNEHLTLVNGELDQLIYSVTHDLRSPLSSLSGLIELINDQTDVEDVKEYTALMTKSIEKQNDFIISILKSAQTQSEKVSDFCNLATIVDNVIAQNHTVLNGKEVKFIKELAATDIFCNVTKLQAVLNNLISNAVKYSDNSKTWPFIKIRSAKAGSKLIIEVQDNGIGISSQNKEHIFDKYFVAQQGANSMGIGLYLVKNMVMQMEGEIEVQSKPGQGSTFTLKLPGIA